MAGPEGQRGHHWRQRYRSAVQTSAFALRALAIKSGTNLQGIAFRVRIFPEIIELKAYLVLLIERWFSNFRTV